MRHHDITPAWKSWYRQGMASRGIAASQLAGLHAHFLLRAVQALRPGDGLCFVMAAEWLDNGYGAAMRLLCASEQIQVAGLWLADADDAVFDDALVSAAVLQLQARPPGSPAAIGRLAVSGLHTVRQVGAPALKASARWSEFARQRMPELGPGVALGELFRITRGQVTGMNAAWVLPAGQAWLPPGLVLPAVTRARDHRQQRWHSRPGEYKGSNSEINSRKRLNKEAAQNARAWLAGFGGQVVPAVALQGVFKDRYVIEAQDTPMLIFWGHRLDDLRDFIQVAA